MGWVDKLLGRKDSAVGSLLSMRRVGRPVWSERNFKSFAKEGYTQNVVAYRSIRLIAENVAAIQPLLYEGRRELTEHPLLNVINRPNPWQGRADLMDALVSYFRIAGNAYLEGVTLDGDLRELYALRPDRMSIVPGRRGYPAAYVYKVNEEAKATFNVDVGPSVQLPILHLKDFHPTDDWYGLSPMEAAAFSIDVFNAAGGYNKALLDNSASPSGALVFKGDKDGGNTLGDDQFNRLKAQMEESTKARGTPAGRSSEGGLEWQAMGMSPKDLEFTAGKREAARETALAFGVPPMLLGIPGDNTYSNYQEANRAFHRQTVLPLTDRIFGALTNWVQPTYPGVLLTYDLDKVDALAGEREAAWKRVQDADFLTTDEKRDATGYAPYKPKLNADGTAVEPGGTILVSGTMTPLDDIGVVPGGAEPPADPNAAE